MTKWRNSQKCILQPAVFAWSSRLPQAVFKLDFLFSLSKPLIPSLSSRRLMIHYPTALHGHNSYKLLLYSHINISCFSLPTLHIWNERRILIFFGTSFHTPRASWTRTFITTFFIQYKIVIVTKAHSVG